MTASVAHRVAAAAVYDARKCAPVALWRFHPLAAQSQSGGSKAGLNPWQTHKFKRI
jgi:hypothetical protein